mmetsp:Transcript_52091/g.135628  ORF Transcript_52091/g.135628 Transcript_52091/m.135628 type:complete len:118 (-) Transcript_52091:64-417(-)
MLARSQALRSALARSRPRKSGGGFGSPRDHEPLWIEKWNKDTRQGKDAFDWFFRAFNATGIYEVFLKSSPRFYGFIVGGGMLGGYYWSRMWDHAWNHINQGKLYAHVPYVYPAPEED